MSNHNHSCVCSHSEVKFCKHCNTVYCKGCNQEWTARSYSYWNYNTPVTYLSGYLQGGSKTLTDNVHTHDVPTVTLTSTPHTHED